MTYGEKRAAMKIKKKNTIMIILLILSLLFIIAMAWKITVNLSAPYQTAATHSSYNERYIAGLKEQMKVSPEQEYAVTLALEYLKTQAFSQKGLIEQLQYSNCTLEDATWAASYCGADWNDQAILRACEYIDSMPFSYKGLVQQLEYDGFTHDEAKYGVSKCGADWNEQAASKAKSYAELLSFTRDQLVDQLVSDGFTKEQARYGAHQVLK